MRILGRNQEGKVKLRPETQRKELTPEQKAEFARLNQKIVDSQP